MISEQTVVSVRSANIVDVLQQYIDLKKKGATYHACCPFHDEKTPSFTVTPARNRYKCFGCGVSGDAIQFVMAHKHLNFAEAVEAIAHVTGITVDYEQGYDVQEIKEKRALEEEMYKQLDFAKKKYQEQYRKNADVQKYWTDRRFTDDDAIEWGIGFAPDGGRYLWDYLKDFGKDEEAVKAGLVKQKDGHTYDFFRNRLMIPIEDSSGRVVGFGGRRLDGEKEFKYLNSADGPLFKKGKMLFGLSRAAKKVRECGLVNLVEGYLDVMRMHQLDVINTVAACGTAFTADQAKLLRRFGAVSVRIVGDGDAAGAKMMNSAVEILMEEGLNAYVYTLPESEDPDSYFTAATIAELEDKQQDAIVWKCEHLAKQIRKDDIASAAEIRQQMAEFLLRIKNITRREAYYPTCAKLIDIKPNELKKLVERVQKQAEETTVLSEEEKEGLPDWMDAVKVNIHGFDQNFQSRKGYPVGIYFKSPSAGVTRITNFTIRPLYHLMDQTNNRRLIEIFNGRKTSVVEMPTRALLSVESFRNEAASKGAFSIEPPFNNNHFVRLSGWIMDNMNPVFELKTMGWQPEGFWAFSDRCVCDGELKEYNDMGVVDIKDESFISLGISSVQKDYRQENNLYENDLYLKYTKSPIDFEQWAALFCKVYPENGPLGISFALYTVFKDIVAHITKIPHLYCYGPKGSGKSDFAESLTWLFFSGKNADGKLIQGFNLNPGQSTYFSFFSRLERFRNCPILFNEFDENMIEDYKFGAIKSAYDGEGREVGDGESGKRRKTMIQKVHGTLILVGQYLSVRDDGSVLSRSLTCPFRLERVKKLTDEDVRNHRQLKDWEERGLSSIIVELLQYRKNVQDLLKDQFLADYKRLTADARAQGVNAETRILKNYSLCTSIVKVFSKLITLPFDADQFYEKCLKTVIEHNLMLKDNSALNGFWKIVENLFDQGLIKPGNYFEIKRPQYVDVVHERTKLTKRYDGDILFIRFSSLYALYAKEYRQRGGDKAPDEETLHTYLRDQPYFIGLVSNYSFQDKRTSAYALKYSEIGVGLEYGRGSISTDNGSAESAENGQRNEVGEVPF